MTVNVTTMPRSFSASGYVKIQLKHGMEKSHWKGLTAFHKDIVMKIGVRTTHQKKKNLNFCSYSSLLGKGGGGGVRMYISHFQCDQLNGSMMA